MCKAATSYTIGIMYEIHIYNREKHVLDFDPQPDVPTGMNPMAQCAFEILVLNVSAIRTSYRS